MQHNQSTILQIYELLYQHFGARNWWPAETPFEVVIGAILTQNTAWTNVEKAITNLKSNDALTPQRIVGLTPQELEILIKPSGFFRQKTLRLQDFAAFLLCTWDGDLDKLCSGPLPEARERLLARKGIGPETADSILLYAAGRPSFVVDAYTMRIFTRIGILTGVEDYHTTRAFFMRELPAETQLFNEYHALIVQLAKTHCRKKSLLCESCPVETFCAHSRSQKNYNN